MNAAEAAARYAGLAAIESGITAAKKAAGEDLRAAAESAGLTKGEVATPFGPVTLAENKARTTVVVDDEKAFTDWVKAMSPESVETVERIRPGDRAAILERLVVVTGNVVDPLTGESLDFAHAETVEAAPPSPSYRSSELQRAAKRAAAQWASSRAPSLVDGVLLELPEKSE